MQVPLMETEFSFKFTHLQPSSMCISIIYIYIYIYICHSSQCPVQFSKVLD
jgi:hypothetical protein